MIVASKSPETILNLMKVKEYVTPCTHSIGMYDTDENSFFAVLRGRDRLSPSCLSNNPRFYQIAFQNSCEDPFIQPAELYNGEHIEFLWMEGNLSEQEVKKLQAEGQTEDSWSVRLLLRHLLETKTPIAIDGEFACVYSDGLEVYAFTNGAVPLFCDDTLTVCTHPFAGSKTLPRGKVYRIDFDENKFVSIAEFDVYRKMEM